MVEAVKNFTVREVGKNERQIISKVVTIHLAAFKGFFLTFMGRGFLTQMYQSSCEHEDSGLLVAFDDAEPIGFLSYTRDASGLYRFRIKRKLIPFAWYALGAFFRKPKVLVRLFRAFLKPKEAKRDDKYVELGSLGVALQYRSKGVGSQLIGHLKQNIDFTHYEYIALTTDAVGNEAAIHVYEKNGFVRKRKFTTHEGRSMLEFQYPDRSPAP